MATVNGTQNRDILLGTINSDAINGLGENDVLVGSSVAASPARTILAFDGTGFDATQLYSSTVVKVDGQYTMLYAGLGFDNHQQIGRATSTDGVTWTRSDQPVLAYADSQAWADFRLLPRSLMYEDGTYKLWFKGANSNLISDPGYISGFGYATSPDGVNWTMSSENPIRSELNSPPLNLIELWEVVKVDNQYYAYYGDLSPGGDVLKRATSTDGVHFTDDITVPMGQDFELLAATAVDGPDPYILSVWRKGDQQYLATSKDGIDFSIVSGIYSPEIVGITSLLLEDGQLELFGAFGVGNINWGGGNVVIRSATSAFALDADPDVIDGGTGNDLLFGGVGYDSYVFADGWGIDTIADPDAAGKILFDGIAESELTFSNVGGNLVVTDGTNRVTFDNYYTKNYAYDFEFESVLPPLNQIVATVGNGSVQGTDGDEAIIGLGGNERLSGLAGDDILVGGPGNDQLDGGTGLDVAIFAGVFANFRLQGGEARVLVQDTTQAQGNDRLTDVELLQFDDGYYDARNDTFTADGFATPQVEALLAGGLPTG